MGTVTRRDMNVLISHADILRRNGQKKVPDGHCGRLAELFDLIFLRIVFCFKNFVLSRHHIISVFRLSTNWTGSPGLSCPLALRASVARFTKQCPTCPATGVCPRPGCTIRSTRLRSRYRHCFCRLTETNNAEWRLLLFQPNNKSVRIY